MPTVTMSKTLFTHLLALVQVPRHHWSWWRPVRWWWEHSHLPCGGETVKCTQFKLLSTCAPIGTLFSKIWSWETTYISPFLLPSPLVIPSYFQVLVEQTHLGSDGWEHWCCVSHELWMPEAPGWYCDYLRDNAHGWPGDRQLYWISLKGNAYIED